MESMKNLKRMWVYGLAAGLMAAIIDVSLILAVDPSAAWDALEAALFWTVAGFVVVVSETGLRHYTHGVMLTVMLNLPWYISLGPASGQLAHVPPLLIMSIMFGFVFGRAHEAARS